MKTPSVLFFEVKFSESLLSAFNFHLHLFLFALAVLLITYYLDQLELIFKINI